MTERQWRIEWSLKVGGSDTEKYKLVTVGNKLRFIVKGFLFTVR